MPDRRQLQELHEQVTAEIIESRTREMSEMRAASEAATKASEARQAEEREQIAKLLGVEVSELEKQADERQAAAEKRYHDAETTLIRESENLSPGFSAMEAESNFLPEGARMLHPGWVASFTSQGRDEQQTMASASVQRDILTGGGTQDYWNWASGGGWGCAGSGVGEIQSWVEFGFWFYPTVSKFYSIQPLFRYRGFYIVQADDGFWDCKYARTVVSAWVNVHQYNWKGWNAINVLDRGDDNINVNSRFDDDRYTYNSYLLGGGDWPGSAARSVSTPGLRAADPTSRTTSRPAPRTIFRFPGATSSRLGHSWRTGQRSRARKESIGARNGHFRRRDSDRFPLCGDVSPHASDPG
jgi:hypothetical protein